MFMKSNLKGKFAVRSEPFSWMSWLENEDYYLQLTQLLDAVQGGAAAVSECLMTAAKINPDDDESWYREWKATAEISKARGELAFAAGNLVSAQANWLRASTYFRTAEVFLKLDDPRRKPVLGQMRAASGLYLQHMAPAGEIVEIPNFDGGLIEGYFLRPPGPKAPRPVVICIGGPDHLKDEHLWRMRSHALDRELSLLLIDFLDPGTFERKKMFGRHGATLSIGSCVDYLIGRGDVDAERIAIYGEGLGASLATLAAVQDSRFSAAVCDGGILDSVERAFSVQQFVGSRDGSALKGHVEKLTRRSLAKRIGCPVLVTVGESGGLDAGYVAGLYDSINLAGSNITLKLSSRLEATGAEAQASNPTIVNEFVFDWLSDRLRERPATVKDRPARALQLVASPLSENAREALKAFR